ncbi:MAG: cysteine peptidase family C39 domain-containing protein, partial [Candidatus Omnitrophica bacterium]|nr:cysteine peptidase family C39 domain-containing protein [Candidatus Omnitrophota bacterium]
MDSEKSHGKIKMIGVRGKFYSALLHIGNKQEPPFKSSFKAWIRVVAFLVVAVFLPEQVAQAVEYDWRVIWQKPAAPLGAFAPSYLKDARQMDIPLTIKNILKDIAGKPVNAIQISPTLSIELEKPLNITTQRIEEIYNWLKGRPCGAKAFFDYLNYKGAQVVEQDVAVMALTIDILNGVVKPEGDPKIIKNSLFALSKVSEFFKNKAYPVKIGADQIIAGTIPVPFIAHFKGDHYVLVTRIDGDKVYFSDEHKEEYLPLEKFLAKFSGYALVTKLSSNNSVYTLLSDAEARTVLGAGYDSGSGDEFGYGESSPVNVGAPVSFTQGTFNTGTSMYSRTNSIQPSWYIPQPVILGQNSILNPNSATHTLDMDMVMTTTYGTGLDNMMVRMSQNLQGEGYYVTPGDHTLADGHAMDINNRAFQTKDYINESLYNETVLGKPQEAPAYLTPEEQRAVMAGTSGRYAYGMRDIDNKVSEYNLFASGQMVSVNFYGGAFSRTGDTIYGKRNDKFSGIGVDSSTLKDVYSIHPELGLYELEINSKGNISPVVATQTVLANTASHYTEGTWSTGLTTNDYAWQARDVVQTNELPGDAKIIWNNLVEGHTNGILAGAGTKNIEFINGRPVIRSVESGTRREIQLLDLTTKKPVEGYSAAQTIETAPDGAVYGKGAVPKPYRVNMLGQVRVGGLEGLFVGPIDQDTYGTYDPETGWAAVRPDRIDPTTINHEDFHPITSSLGQSTIEQAAAKVKEIVARSGGNPAVLDVALNAFGQDAWSRNNFDPNDKDAQKTVSEKSREELVNRVATWLTDGDTGRPDLNDALERNYSKVRDYMQQIYGDKIDFSNPIRGQATGGQGQALDPQVSKILAKSKTEGEIFGEVFIGKERWHWVDFSRLDFSGGRPRFEGEYRIGTDSPIAFEGWARVSKSDKYDALVSFPGLSGSPTLATAFKKNGKGISLEEVGKAIAENELTIDPTSLSQGALGRIYDINGREVQRTIAIDTSTVFPGVEIPKSELGQVRDLADIQARAGVPMGPELTNNLAKVDTDAFPDRAIQAHNSYRNELTKDGTISNPPANMPLPTAIQDVTDYEEINGDNLRREIASTGYSWNNKNAVKISGNVGTEGGWTRVADDGSTVNIIVDSSSAIKGKGGNSFVDPSHILIEVTNGGQIIAQGQGKAGERQIIDSNITLRVNGGTVILSGTNSEDITGKNIEITVNPGDVMEITGDGAGNFIGGPLRQAYQNELNLQGNPLKTQTADFAEYAQSREQDKALRSYIHRNQNWEISFKNGELIYTPSIKSRLEEQSVRQDYGDYYLFTRNAEAFKYFKFSLAKGNFRALLNPWMELENNHIGYIDVSEEFLSRTEATKKLSDIIQAHNMYQALHKADALESQELGGVIESIIKETHQNFIGADKFKFGNLGDNLGLASGFGQFELKVGAKHLIFSRERGSQGTWSGDTWLNAYLRYDKNGSLSGIDTEFLRHSSATEGEITKQIKYDFKNGRFNFEVGKNYQVGIGDDPEIMATLLTFNNGEIGAQKLIADGKTAVRTDRMKGAKDVVMALTLTADAFSDFVGLKIYADGYTNTGFRMGAIPNLSPWRAFSQLLNMNSTNQGSPLVLSDLQPEFAQVAINPDTGKPFKSYASAYLYYLTHKDKPIILQDILKEEGHNMLILHNEPALSDGTTILFDRRGTFTENGIWLKPKTGKDGRVVVGPSGEYLGDFDRSFLDKKMGERIAKLEEMRVELAKVLADYPKVDTQNVNALEKFVRAAPTEYSAFLQKLDKINAEIDQLNYQGAMGADVQSDLDKINAAKFSALKEQAQTIFDESRSTLDFLDKNIGQRDDYKKLSGNAKIRLYEILTERDFAVQRQQAVDKIKSDNKRMAPADLEKLVSAKLDELQRAKQQEEFELHTVLTPIIPKTTNKQDGNILMVISGLHKFDLNNKDVIPYLTYYGDIKLNLSDSKFQELKQNTEAIRELLGERAKLIDQGKSVKEIMKGITAQILAKSYALTLPGRGFGNLYTIGTAGLAEPMEIARFNKTTMRLNSNTLDVHAAFLANGRYYINSLLANIDPNILGGIVHDFDVAQGRVNSLAPSEEAEEPEYQLHRGRNMDISPYLSATALDLTSAETGELKGRGRLEFLYVNQQMQKNFAQGAIFNAHNAKGLTIITPGAESFNNGLVKTTEIYRLGEINGLFAMGGKQAGGVQSQKGVFNGKGDFNPSLPRTGDNLPDFSIIVDGSVVGSDGKPKLVSRVIAEMPIRGKFGINTLLDNAASGERLFYLEDEGTNQGWRGRAISALLNKNGYIGAGKAELRFDGARNENGAIDGAYTIRGRGVGLWDSRINLFSQESDWHKLLEDNSKAAERTGGVRPPDISVVNEEEEIDPANPAGVVVPGTTGGAPAPAPKEDIPNIRGKVGDESIGGKLHPESGQTEYPYVLMANGPTQEDDFGKLKVYRGAAQGLDEWDYQLMGRTIGLGLRNTDGSAPTIFTDPTLTDGKPFSLDAETVAQFDQRTPLSTSDVISNKDWKQLTSGYNLKDQDFRYSRSFMVGDINVGTRMFVLPQKDAYVDFYHMTVGKNGAEPTEARKLWLVNNTDTIKLFNVDSLNFTGVQELAPDGLQPATKGTYDLYNHWLVVSEFGKSYYLAQPILSEVIAFEKSLSEIKSDQLKEKARQNLRAVISQLLGGKVDDATLTSIINNAIATAGPQNKDTTKFRQDIISLGQAIAEISGRDISGDIGIKLKAVGYKAEFTPFTSRNGKETDLITYDNVELGDHINGKKADPFIKANNPFPWLSAPIPYDNASQMSKALQDGSGGGSPDRIDATAIVNYLGTLMGKKIDNPFFAEYVVNQDVPLLGINNFIFNLTNYRIGDKGAYFGWGNGILRDWSAGSTVTFEPYYTVTNNGKEEMIWGKNPDPKGKTEYSPFVNGRFTPAFSNEFKVVKNEGTGTFEAVVYKAGAWWNAEGKIVDNNGKMEARQSFVPLTAKDGKALDKGASVLSHLAGSGLYALSGAGQVGNFVDDPKVSYWHPQGGFVLSFDITDPIYNKIYLANNSSSSDPKAGKQNPVPETVASSSAAFSVKINGASVTNDNVKIGEGNYRELTGKVQRDAVIMQPFANAAMPAGFIANTAINMDAGVMAPDETGAENIQLGTGRGILWLSEGFGVYQGDIFFEDGQFKLGLDAGSALVERNDDKSIKNFLALRHHFAGDSMQALELAYHYNKEQVINKDRATKQEQHTYFKHFDKNNSGVLKVERWQSMEITGKDGSKIKIEVPVREAYIPVGDNSFYVGVKSTDGEVDSSFEAERLSPSTNKINVDGKEYYSFSSSAAIGVDDNQTYIGDFLRAAKTGAQQGTASGQVAIDEKDATQAFAYTDDFTGWTYYLGKIALNMESPFTVGVTPEGGSSVNFTNAVLAIPAGEYLAGETKDAFGLTYINAITPVPAATLGYVIFDEKGQFSIQDAEIQKQLRPITGPKSISVTLDPVMGTIITLAQQQNLKPADLAAGIQSGKFAVLGNGQFLTRQDDGSYKGT